MKQVVKFTLVLICLFHGVVSAQVSVSGNNPDKSAALDLNETDKGFLIPRVSLTSTTNKTVINGGNPSKGLLIYNINASVAGTGAKGEGFYYWDGKSLWRRMISNDDVNTTYWNLDGNILGTQKVLGTLDNDSNGKPLELPIIIGNNEEARILRGSAAINTTDVQKISSLRVSNVPAGSDADNVLVLRTGKNEVWQRAPLIFKYPTQKGMSQTDLKIQLKETYVVDLIYVRIEKAGYFGTAAFVCTRATVGETGNDRKFMLTYLWGGVEPVNDSNRTGYVVESLTPITAYEPNRLRLTYPNAPSDGFNFEIALTIDGGVKNLTIKNLSNVPFTEGEGYSVTQQRLY